MHRPKETEAVQTKIQFTILKELSNKCFVAAFRGDSVNTAKLEFTSFKRLYTRLYSDMWIRGFKMPQRPLGNWVCVYPLRHFIVLYRIQAGLQMAIPVSTMTTRFVMLDIINKALISQIKKLSENKCFRVIYEFLYVTSFCNRLFKIGTIFKTFSAYFFLALQMCCIVYVSMHVGLRRYEQC